MDPTENTAYSGNSANGISTIGSHSANQTRVSDLLISPVQLREISKEGSQRRPNDANNDSAEGDLPVFEPTAANVSAFVGQTVYLPCRVRNLGDKVVSRVKGKNVYPGGSYFIKPRRVL
ncbi:hypothetical protein K0M31_009503 [Melipona bicolor]|uniref:Uncharacterized protein n=1 Tax=Melipona bicolor TaxID=60889 RepID=A0AA40FNV1_9HYME|nr:hypothetical protein K0M31_009503 [Melipona bicolor]